jgi:hypothetical protein
MVFENETMVVEKETQNSGSGKLEKEPFIHEKDRVKLRAENLDDVLKINDFYISRFKNDQSPLGYFTAVYKLTTQQVKTVCTDCRKLEHFHQMERTQFGKEQTRETHDWVDHRQGDFHFDDPDRMERMVVKFANRYFEALEFYVNRDIDKITGPWAEAFKVADQKTLITLQHFLLSANAHINLDLAIAAAEICIEENVRIEDFEDDFKTMNDVLAGLYDQMNEGLSMMWPLFGRWMLKWTDAIFGIQSKLMVYLREESWKNAVTIHGLLKDENFTGMHEKIKENEEIVAKLGKFLAKPGIIGAVVLWLGSVHERYSHGVRISLFENSKYIHSK